MRQTVYLLLVLCLSGVILAHEEVMPENDDRKPAFQHHCIHDEIVKAMEEKNGVDPMLLKNSRDTVLRDYYLGQPWENMRITNDYSTLRMNTGPYYDYLVKCLFEPIKQDLQQMLKVKRRKDPIKTASRTCASRQLPIHKDNQEYKDTDLVLYYMIENKPTASFIAWASGCAHDKGSMRPTWGVINVNMAHVQMQANRGCASSNIVMDKSTTLHEIVHVLGFSASKYKYFQDENLRDRDQNTITATAKFPYENMITLPTVLKKAKAHFGCSTMKGVPLENQGGSGSKGSHWERTVMGDDFMTASSMHGPIISDISLAFLQDSGWYMPDYSKAEKLLWGKGRGCQAVTEECPKPENSPSFCTKRGEQGCSLNGLWQAVCTGDNFSKSGCMYESTQTKWANCRTGGDAFSEQYYNTKKGPGSRCVATLRNGRQDGKCYPVTCNQAGTEATFVINDKITYVCKKNLEVHGPYTHHYGVPDLRLVCPRDIKMFCGEAPRQ